MENNKSNKGSVLFLLIGLKALLTIGIGLAFLINPMGMITTFSYLLGLALLVFGALGIYDGIKKKDESSFWQLLIEDGVLQVIVGIILLAWPGLTPNIIMIIMGIWMIFGGIIQFIIANRYKDSLGQRNFRGVITVILGLVIVFNPSIGVRIFTMIIGALSLIYGIYMVLLLLRFGKGN